VVAGDGGESVRAPGSGRGGRRLHGPGPEPSGGHPAARRAGEPVTGGGTEPGLDAGRRRPPVDTRVAYRFVHPRRKGLGVDLVVYHGGLSHALAFESVTSETLVDRASAAAGRRGGLVAIALDGETFGHHHKWADRAWPTP